MDVGPPAGGRPRRRRFPRHRRPRPSPRRCSRASDAGRPWAGGDRAWGACTRPESGPRLLRGNVAEAAVTAGATSDFGRRPAARSDRSRRAVGPAGSPRRRRAAEKPTHRGAKWLLRGAARRAGCGWHVRPPPNCPCPPFSYRSRRHDHDPPTTCTHRRHAGPLIGRASPVAPAISCSSTPIRSPSRRPQGDRTPDASATLVCRERFQPARPSRPQRVRVGVGASSSTTSSTSSPTTRQTNRASTSPSFPGRRRPRKEWVGDAILFDPSRVNGVLTLENLHTAYIDASNVYGPSAERGERLAGEERGAACGRPRSPCCPHTNDAEQPIPNLPVPGLSPGSVTDDYLKGAIARFPRRR